MKKSGKNEHHENEKMVREKNTISHTPKRIISVGPENEQPEGLTPYPKSIFLRISTLKKSLSQSFFPKMSNKNVLTPPQAAQAQAESEDHIA